MDVSRICPEPSYAASLSAPVAGKASLAALCCVFLVSIAPAWADSIVLRGGAKVEGLLLDHRQDDKHLVIRVRQKDVSVAKSQVVESTRTGTAQERYRTALQAYGQQLDDQWQLARWCDANELFDEEARHLRRCLEIDPDYSKASEQLRKLTEQRRIQPQATKSDAQPNRNDQAVARPKEGPATAKGDGPLNPPKPEPNPEGKAAEQPEPNRAAPRKQEAEQQQKRLEAERTVKRLFAQMTGKSQPAAEAARQELAGLTDPLALGPLVNGMGRLRAQDRLLVTRVFGRIKGEGGDEALALVAVADETPELRALATRLLKSRNPTPAACGPAITRAFLSGEPDLIYNAAELCTALNLKPAVPFLVASLVTPVANTIAVATSDPPNKARRHELYLLPPGGLRGVKPSGSRLVDQWLQMGPKERQLLSKEYGAWRTIYQRPEGIVSLQQHEPVLAALRTLTGRDFGYDQDAWWHWLAGGGAQKLGIFDEGSEHAKKEKAGDKVTR
ncbi:MAG: hypothetical protein HY000_21860, partial [Planctomycetes bacterium]|nr:hypothetical protein [Planctomycetota bacterium]